MDEAEGRVRQAQLGLIGALNTWIESGSRDAIARAVTLFLREYALSQGLPGDHGLEKPTDTDVDRIVRYMLRERALLTNALTHAGYKNADTHHILEAPEPIGPWDDLYWFIRNDSSASDEVGTASGEVAIFLDAGCVDAKTAAEVVEALGLLYGGEMLMTSASPQPPRRGREEEGVTVRRAGGQR